MAEILPNDAAQTVDTLKAIVTELSADRGMLRAIYLAVEGLRACVGGTSRDVQEDDVLAVAELVERLETRLCDRTEQVEQLRFAVAPRAS